MPTIAIFYGIVIQMYWREHGPPHIHAIYQGFEALVAIETGGHRRTPAAPSIANRPRMGLASTA